MGAAESADRPLAMLFQYSVANPLPWYTHEVSQVDLFIDDVIVPLFLRLRKLNNMSTENLRFWVSHLNFEIHAGDSIECIIRNLSFIMAEIANDWQRNILRHNDHAELDSIALQLLMAFDPNALVYFVEAHVYLRDNVPSTVRTTTSWIMDQATDNELRLDDPERLVGLMRRAGAIRAFEKAVRRVADEGHSPHCHALLDAIRQAARWSAVAMGVHDRLGEKSPLRCLSTELLAMIADAADERGTAPDIDELEFFYGAYARPVEAG